MGDPWTLADEESDYGLPESDMDPVEDRYIFADAHRCDGWYARVCASGEPDRPFTRLDWFEGEWSGRDSFISIEAALVDFFHGGPCPEEGRHHDKPCRFSTTTLVPADWMNDTTATAIGALFAKNTDAGTTLDGDA